MEITQAYGSLALVCMDSKQINTQINVDVPVPSPIQLNEKCIYLRYVRIVVFKDILFLWSLCRVTLWKTSVTIPYDG